MYTAHFNLREQPFSIAPDPAFLYMSARHQEALGHLLYGTGQHGGFVQLTGEVGTGKTTIVRTLLAQKLSNVDIAMIHNPRQNEVEFLASICDELAIDYPGRGDGNAPLSLKQLVDVLNRHLLASHAAGRRTVLIIDEAQNLPQPVLEQVRLLTNLETDKEKLLRIMLIGQPELDELLSRPDLRQLASRITARFHLTPLSVVETLQYIIHRLHVAGGPADLFTDTAMRRVHRYSGGIPRQVNALCDRALLGAYARGLRTVTPAIVDQAAGEVLGNRARPSAGAGWHHRLLRLPLAWVEGALAIAALAVAGVLLYRTFIEPAPAATAVAPAAARPIPVAAAPPPPLPPPPRPSGIGALRATAQPLSAVMARLIGLWKPGLNVPGGQNVCQSLQREGLDCYRGEASWDELRQINLPVILTLAFEPDRNQHVLLRALDGNVAAIDTPQGPVQLDLETLEPLWNGEFLLLWQRPIEVSRITERSRGEPVLWLRRQLSAIDGTPLDSPLQPQFGPQLRTQLARFQARHGIAEQGFAGPRTLLMLAARQPRPGAPSLEDAP